MSEHADDVLRRVTILSPCDRRWEQMAGDDRRRFCDRCQRDVVNVSDMTETEAKSFVRDNLGRACVRLERARPGALRRGTAGAVVALSLAACSRSAEPVVQDAPSVAAKDAGPRARPLPASVDAGGPFDGPSIGDVDAAFYGGVGLMGVGDPDGGLKLKGKK